MVTQFPTSNLKEIRSYVVNMENLIENVNNLVQSLSKTEALTYQMGRTSGAAQSVANAMRDFVKEIETLEKMEPQNVLK